MFQTSVPSEGPLANYPLPTQSRLMLPFCSSTSCHPGPGLGETSFPDELKELGVDEASWTFHIKKLQEEVQPQAPTGCGEFGYCYLAIFGCFCPLWSSQGKYHGLLRQWLEEFNAKVLGSKSLYAKFQSNEFMVSNNFTTGCHKERRSWLAIALNARTLREEPVLWKNKCCVDEMIVPGGCEKVCWCCGPKRCV